MRANLSDPLRGTETAGYGNPSALAGRVLVRPFQPGDRNEVRRICCDTGFLGRPIDPLFRDRDLFADLFTSPYIDHEPQWTLVAEVDGHIAGYLMGSVSESFERTQMLCGFRAVRGMLRRWSAGGYADHPRSRRFLRWLLTASWRERPRHPAGAAHLHFNLEESQRGRFIGKLLWLEFMERLETSGIRRLYAEFYSRPGRQPERVYPRYGFRPYDRCETTLFRPEIQGPVHLVCMIRRVDRPPSFKGSPEWS